MDIPKNTRHRHVVVLPIVAVLCVISLSGDVLHGSTVEGSTEGSIMNSSDRSLSLALPSGAVALLAPAASIEASDAGTTLVEGSLLIAGEGMIELQASQALVSTLGGAIHVSLLGDVLSVASISAPAVVRHGDQLAAIPMGFQWRWTLSDPLPSSDDLSAFAASRSVDPLPRRFLEEQLAAISDVDPSMELPEARSALPDLTSEQGLLLAGAEDRAQEGWTRDVLGFIRNALETNDNAALQTVLSDEVYSDVLKTTEARSALSTLLLRLPRSQMSLSVLQQLSSAELTLLASFHPALHAFAWAVDAGDDDAAALRVLLFPQADVQSEAFSAFAAERWASDLRSILSASARPADDANVIITKLAPVVTHLEELGYPERARRLAHDLTQIGMLYESDLSAAAATALEAMDDRPVETAPEQASTSEGSSSSTAPVMSATELEGRITEILRVSGALFTVETSVSAMDGMRARVQSIVYGSSQGDRMLSFVFDLATEQVSAITLAGEEYPYAMGWEEFIAWVRK